MPRRLSTARQALRVLAYLLTHPEGVVAQEVAQILGKSLTTAYALLNSLVDEGFAEKTERGYRPRIFPQEKGTNLGEALEELYLRTRERSYLVLLDPQGPVLLTRGRQGQPHPLGETLPKEWHALALGKVLLAFGSKAPGPLTPRTPYTLTDPVALEEELARVRESGLAVEIEEYAPGLSGLAAPLFGPEGEFLGALGVAIPSRRFPFAFTRLARALFEVARVTPHLPPPPPLRETPSLHVLDSPAALDPPEELKVQANLRDYSHSYQESLRDPEGFWGEWAKTLVWTEPWRAVWDRETGIWFVGGKTNIALNALDRHLPALRTQLALITLDGEGRLEKWTYKEVHEFSARLAGRLQALGVRRGDRVAVYLPTGLEAALTLLALARLGATHVALPVGLGAAPLRERLLDLKPRLLVAADGYYRRGQLIPLKTTVEEALKGLDLPVLWHRRGSSEFLEEALEGPLLEAEPVDSDHPLFALYTSGSTGRPKGVVHTHGGYMVGVSWHLQNFYDLKPGELLYTTGDLSWIVGHSFGLYAPLLLGATVLLSEDRPDHPSPAAFYQRVRTLGVDILLTSPTFLRALRQSGEARPTRLRLVYSVGEHLAPEVLLWSRAHLAHTVDHYWQTELGAPVLGTPLTLPLKPGYAGVPLPGVEARVVDGQGQVLPPGERGHLVLLRPFPSMAMGFLDGRPLFQGGLYWTGDLAVMDGEGYFRLLGRSDEEIKLGEHRFGTAELESTLLTHPQVAEAAAVGVPGEEGEEVVLFVVPRQELPEEVKPLLSEKLRLHLMAQLGPLVNPKRVEFVDRLPRTKSGKILRRLLKARLLGQDPGDVSSLEDEDGGKAF